MPRTSRHSMLWKLCTAVALAVVLPAIGSTFARPSSADLPGGEPFRPPFIRPENSRVVPTNVAVRCEARNPSVEAAVRAFAGLGSARSPVLAADPIATLFGGDVEARGRYVLGEGARCGVQARRGDAPVPIVPGVFRITPAGGLVALPGAIGGAVPALSISCPGIGASPAVCNGGISSFLVFGRQPGDLVIDAVFTPDPSVGNPAVSGTGRLLFLPPLVNVDVAVTPNVPAGGRGQIEAVVSLLLLPDCRPPSLCFDPVSGRFTDQTWNPLADGRLLPIIGDESVARPVDDTLPVMYEPPPAPRQLPIQPCKGVVEALTGPPEVCRSIWEFQAVRPGSTPVYVTWTTPFIQAGEFKVLNLDAARKLSPAAFIHQVVLPSLAPGNQCSSLCLPSGVVTQDGTITVTPGR